MRVTVRFLGIYGDLVGQRSGVYELDEPSTVARLTALLFARHARLAELRGSVRLMVNGRQPAPDDVLTVTDRVAALGPIAGGSVRCASP